jgi:hypothetical protein
MSEIKFVKKPGAERSIRYSGPVKSMLEGIGTNVLNSANSQLKLNGDSDLSPGYRMRSEPGALKGPRGFGRWRVSVTAFTPHARRHNAKYNVLLRALGGGQ